MAKLGFIGMGNMGYAMLKGAMRMTDKSEILFADANDGRRKDIYWETGIRFVESNAECANAVKYLVLVVKPQFYSEVIQNIRDIVRPDQVIISIITGKSIEELKDDLGTDKRIVRAMPNTPALIGEGMTGISYEASLFEQEELEYIAALFESFGKVQVVSEELMSAVVCASGSSPAYVYLFIEAMADACVKYGMPRQMAYEMVSQTVHGAAQMVLQTGKHPGELKDMVCSPGGTTINAVAALEEAGLRSALFKAADACFAKCKELSKKED